MKRFIRKVIQRMTKDVLVEIIPSEKNEELSCEKAERILQEHHPDVFSSPICMNKVHDKKYDLTVIVPVYNVEKYLHRCMDSLRNQQTKYTYHVVAINDGSTDRSGAIPDLRYTIGTKSWKKYPLRRF